MHPLHLLAGFISGCASSYVYTKFVLPRVLKTVAWIRLKL